MDQQSSDERRQRLSAQVRRLILMRETGPKRAAWHEARARLIWRLHDELRHEDEQASQESDPPPSE